jgi:hypothetical protein
VAWFTFPIGTLITTDLAACVAATHFIGRRYTRSSAR